MSASSNNVRLLNAIIGLCMKQRDWPSLLHDYGYCVHSMELDFETSSGKEISPDLIISSNRQRHCLLFENKGGGLDKGRHQMDNYATLTNDDIKKWVTTMCDEFDITVACVEENEEGISKSISDIGCKFPVIAVRSSSITLINNNFKDSACDALFSAGVPIDLSTAPGHYVKFIADSEEHEIAKHLIVSLVSYARRSKNTFSTQEIAGDSFGESWASYRKEKLRMSIYKKVANILEKASEGEMRGMLNKVRGERVDAIWEFTFGPNGLPEGFKKVANDFVDRVKAEATSTQLMLF